MTTCLGCKRPTRPKKRPTADAHPGTVTMESRGLCCGCYSAHRKAGTLEAFDRGRRGRPAVELVVTACRTCNRATRPLGTALEMFPGTVALKSRGLCCYCYEHQYRNNAHPPDVAGTKAALEAYLTWRAPFRAKAQGLA